MSAVAQTTYSEEEYLQMEVKADSKSEFFRREIFMMAGATQIITGSKKGAGRSTLFYNCWINTMELTM